MKFESKYNFGDKLFTINISPKQIFETCAFCNGIGRIYGEDGTDTSCPKCYGRGGKKQYINEGWRVTGQVTIGEIRIKHRWGQPGKDTIFTNYGPQEELYEEEYMCIETGIGSGSIHKVETLWPTQEEAQAECNRLNAELEEKVA